MVTYFDISEKVNKMAESDVGWRRAQKKMKTCF